MSFDKIHLEPEKKEFKEIMGNGKSYAIPPFQRDYSWESDHLEELWDDIEQMRTTRTQHFMGYIVLQTNDNKNFKIIDGQQRLTTITLFLIASLSYLKKKIDNDALNNEDNQKRFDAYKDTYIGNLDTVTLETIPKLTLNRHNRNHFKDIVHNLEVPRKRGVISTNKKLNKAFEFFDKKLKDLSLDGAQLSETINDICEGLVFTTITVSDELNAYHVFETLNSRGMYLSSPDLLKNYFLSTLAQDQNISNTHFENIEETWEEIIKQLGETNFTSFLRTHIGITDKLLYKKEVFRYLKNKDFKSKDVISYVKNIADNAPIYTALQNSDDSFWNLYGNGQYNDAKRHLTALNLFNIKTPLSLLIAAYHKFKASPQDFVKVVEWINIISIRYNVICQKGAKDQERIYNKIANKLSNENQFHLCNLKKDLKPIYPNDNEFKAAFSRKSLPSRQSNKKILYLLKSIDTHLDHKNSHDNLTLEHVLPFHPNEDWMNYFGTTTYEDAIDRLGNIALLSRQDNMADESFIEKKEILEKSHSAINQNIAHYDKWDIDNLEKHQNWLAKQASSVWKISGL